MLNEVSGANQGIGFAIVKKLVTTPNLIVILTARDEKKGQEVWGKGIEKGYHKKGRGELLSEKSLRYLRQ